MHLQADAADGHALRAQVAHQVVDVVRFAVEPLAAVIVVDQQGIGVRLVRAPEGLGDVPRSQLAEVHGVPEPAPVVRDRLVDDVPGQDPAAIAPDGRADVVLEGDARLGRRERFQPRR